MLSTKLANFRKINLVYLYTLFLLFVLLLSFLFYEKFIIIYPGLIDINGDLIYKNLPFEYGKLIENIIKNNEYFSKISNINFYLTRLPVFPFIIYLINLFSSKLLNIIIIKNIIFFSIIFLICFSFAKEKGYKLKSFLLLLAIFFYNPFNLKIITNFVYADYIVSILLPALFIIIVSNIKKKYFYIGLILFILYLTKSNMFFLSFGLSFFILFYERKISPLLFVLVSMISWGTFGFIKTGKFPIGPSLLSTNTHAMAISFNKDFREFYPLTSVDYIKLFNVGHCADQKTNDPRCDSIIINNEWDYYNYYKNLNLQYLALNKKILFEDAILKVNTIFFNIYEDGQVYKKEERPEKKIIYSLIINKILLLISLFVAVYFFLKNLKSGNYKLEIYFLLIFCLSMPPYIIGWVLSRHLVALFFISQIYLFLKFKSKK
tara:strand:- start:724 stop:2022 length:1299 start_codon:yes stop_codon:yes gene_type:complete